MNPIIIIPARLAATRLPNKPLADINGVPMIARVYGCATQANLGKVVVAAGDQPIVDAIMAVGGQAVLTDPDLPSGSDRIWAALQQIDPMGAHDVIINLQGDLPDIGPETLRAIAAVMQNPDVDIATGAVRITDPNEVAKPNVVKIAMTSFVSFPRRRESSIARERENKALSTADAAGLDPRLRGDDTVGTVGRALYFSRAAIPHGTGDHYHHIGIYAYRRKALQQFVQSPPSPLELQEKLEQLRALELGMRIDVAIVNQMPITIDTPEDLKMARRVLR